MGKGFEEKRMNVTEEEIKSAYEWLDGDPAGKRFGDVQHILTLFAKEDKRIRRIKNFIHNLSFNLSSISDFSEFEKLLKNGGDLVNLGEVTKKSGGIRLVESRGSIEFHIYYDQAMAQEEYSFFSECFGEFVANILILYQFDMSGRKYGKELIDLFAHKSKLPGRNSNGEK